METSAVTARTLQGDGPRPAGQAPPDPWFLTGVSVVVSRVKRDFMCTLVGVFPPVLVVLRPQSRLWLEGAETYTQRAIPDLTSSVPGLLPDSVHVRQARSRCLRCCPGITVTALGRPPHRAREGHGQHLQIHSLVSNPKIGMPTTWV
jgi:hypothetical protein